MFESAPEEQQQNLAITSFASALALHDHVVFSKSYAPRPSFSECTALRVYPELAFNPNGTFDLRYLDRLPASTS